MSTARVAVTCPACSPDATTAHEILKEAGRSTVKCTECSHVHKADLREPATVERRVVVSQEGESVVAHYDVPPDDTLAVGDEFLLDTPEAIMQVQITALQVGSEQRVEETAAEAVETIWSRVVGNVAVDLTLHPKQGAGGETRSLKLRVPGDEAFTVGEVVEHGDEEFSVEGLVVRDDTSGYTRRQFDHDGDMAFAKDLKRVYGRDQSSRAWSAW